MASTSESGAPAAAAAPGTWREPDLDECLAAAEDAARKAGALIAEGQRKGRGAGFDVSNKVGLDLVTSVDMACEELILGLLRPRFEPQGHLFIAEESQAGERLTEAPTWCIDPLDGTVNFVKSFPYACVSIGLVYRGVCVVGAIYCPAHDEMYTARAGGGARLNGSIIRANATERLEDAMVVTNISASRNAAFVDANFACLRACVGDNLGSLRSLGSAAMCIAYCAKGACDVYWELMVGGPWDFAAGVAILTEAGGVCAAPEGGDFDLASLRIVCGAKGVVPMVVARLAPALEAAGGVAVLKPDDATGDAAPYTPAAAGAAAGAGAGGDDAGAGAGAGADAGGGDT